MFLEIVLTLLPMVLTLGDSPTETIRDKAMVMSLVNITIEVKSNRMICPCWSKCNAMQLCTAVSVVPYADGRSGGKCHFTGLEFEEVKTNMVEKTDAVTLRGSAKETAVDDWFTLVSVEDDTCTVEDDNCTVTGTIPGTGKLEYLVFGCKKSFEEAKKICCSQDGQLASLSNTEEYEAVKKTITDWQLTERYFLNIGWSDLVNWYLWGELTKLPPKGDEVWTSNEPNHIGVEKCVTWNRMLTLDDYPCHYETPFICQVKADWYVVKTQLKIGDSCTYDEILSDKTSKKFLIVTCLRNFIDSKALCEEQGGKLASLSDEEEYRKIKNILDVHYKDLKNIWVDVSSTSDLFRWGDDTPLPATIGESPWVLGEPGGHGDCARMKYETDGQRYGINDIKCWREYSILCQIDEN